METKKGIMKNKPFILYLSEPWVNKKDILLTRDNFKLKVIKVYKYRWWKKILSRLGFKIKVYNGVKVKEIDGN